MSKEQSATLRDKATAGVIWSAFERFGQQGCAFVVQLVLARLLAPAEFGLIALVAVFVSISLVIIDAGFSRALIQKKEITDSDLSTVFYFNLLVSIVIAAILYSIAPSVASFYEQGELTGILRYLSFGLIISAFGSVHLAILTRKLLFKKIFWVSFPATALSGLIGIGLALSGYGVWSLVAQTLAQRLLLTIILWFQTGWQPTLTFDAAALKAMFPYGSRLAVSGVLDQGFQNLYVLVIGRVYSVADVGLFQRARALQTFPVQNFQAIISRVAFPLFSSIQEHPDRMKRGMRKCNQLSCLFIFLGMALLAGIAEPLVIVLIGDKWLGSVIFLKWLCLQGALYPLHSMNINLLASIGRSDLVLRVEVIKKVLIILNVFITFRFGILTMIYGMIIISFVSLWLNAFYVKRLLGYGIIEQILDLKIFIMLSFALFCVCHCVVFSWSCDQSAFAVLALSSAVSVVIFLLCLKLCPKELKGDLKHQTARLPWGRQISRYIF